MSFLKKLKNSRHFSVLSKKKDSISSLVQDLDHRNLIVYHIDSETEGNFSLTVRNDDNGDVILCKVCDHYNLHDYKEYFGLKYSLVDENGDHEIFWLDPFKLVGKQLKDTNNVLTFRVKHFPGKPHMIQSEYVRYLMFLQIRNYLLKGDLQLALTEETLLAAYAIQASIGDYDEIENKANYLADIKFLSNKNKSEEMIMEFHKELKGKSPAEMEIEFLEKASKFDTYGTELIVVKTSKGVSINFGVSHNGIITYLHGLPMNTAKIDVFPWLQIGKISYENRTLRVHFHTPSDENSEIIKKNVMIFKCKTSRVCKHLWKFILDQKAFYSFKRGVDVPKMKSSDRIFTFKSKFRYSGRCESELIAAQHDTSYLNFSSTSNIEEDLANFSASSTLKSNGTLPSVLSSGTNGTLKSPMNTFKRRTFLSPVRSTFVRVKPSDLTASTTQLTSNKRDSANNTLELQNENNNSNSTIKINETSSIKSQAIDDEIQNNNNIHSETDLGGMLQAAAVQATSTPTLSAKLHDSSHIEMCMSYSSTRVVNNNNDLNDMIISSSNEPPSAIFELNSDENSSEQSEDDEDKFYEHDERILTKLTDNDNEDLDTENSNNINNNNNSNINNKPQSKWKNLRYTMCIILIVLLIFFLFLFLIQHWKCKLSNDINNDNENNIIKAVNLNSCGYQKTLNKLNDNFNLFFQQMINSLLSFQNENNRWIPWPIQLDDINTTNYDPLFFWFFRQYEEN